MSCRLGFYGTTLAMLGTKVTVPLKLKAGNEILAILKYAEKVVVSKYFEAGEHLKIIRGKENADASKKLIRFQ